MGIIKTSQEINKMFGAYGNKFYRGKKMSADPVLECGKDAWCCQIAIKQHDDGLVCPYCGGTPSDDWSDHIEYKGYNGDLQLNTEPYIVGEGSCAKCGKWWFVTDNCNKEGAVVRYTIPRKSHFFESDDPRWSCNQKKD